MTACSEEIFCGAACSNNGNEDALAGFRVFFELYDPRNTEVYGIPGRQTNNAAHLCAILYAIQRCAKTRPVVIKTCSKLTVSCL